MPILLWLALISCNLIWAMNPTQAKILIQEVGPAWTAWIRYFGAFSAYGLWKAFEQVVRPGKAGNSEFLVRPRSSSEFANLALLSLCAFFISPLSQMTGLAASTAINNSLLVALEPLFTLAMGWLLLGQRLSRLQLLSFPVALLGFSLLSGLLFQSPGELGTAKGDFLIAAATLAEAMFSVYSVRLLRHHRAAPIFGTAVGLGTLLLTGMALALEGPPSFGHLSGTAWMAALWLGPLGTAVTYLIWIWVLERKVPVGLMALTLFVQPLAGAAAGVLFLQESLTPEKIFGGILILGAVVAPEVKVKHWVRSAGMIAFLFFWLQDAGSAGKLMTDQPKKYRKPSASELKAKLTPEQYKCTQEEGTERPFQNQYWNHKEDGIYVDVVSGEPLFSSLDKYDSGSGWPSYTKPIEGGHLQQRSDFKLGVERTEVRSQGADSHLGHVFDDGPLPGGKRFCINSAALRFVPVEKLREEGYSKYLFAFAEKKHWEIATLAGGCFWGMEDLLRQIPGVIETQVGYTGGDLKNARYEDVKKGTTGHAESVQILFDPKKVSYEALLLQFFKMHDPTTANQQGNDRGTQYRSAIFYASDAQKKVAEQVRARVDRSGKWGKPLVTQIVPGGEFWRAEDYHQKYLVKNRGGYTCHYIRKLEF